MEHDFERIRKAVPLWNKYQESGTYGVVLIFIGVVCIIFLILSNLSNLRNLPILVVLFITAIMIHGIMLNSKSKQAHSQLEREHGRDITKMIQAVVDEIDVIDSKLTPDTFKFSQNIRAKIKRPGKSDTSYHHWKGRFYGDWVAITCLQTTEFYLLDRDSFDIRESDMEFLGQRGARIILGEHGEMSGSITGDSLANLRRWQKGE